MNEITSEKNLYQGTYEKKEESMGTLQEKWIYRALKRSFDIISASIGLIILSPAFLIIAIIIKQEDKGPVFYKQKRTGQYGKSIEIYKFRSMRVGAENIENMLTEEQRRTYRKEYKLDNDPRITKCGDKLRKSSLDELPQLVNIICGDMSVVGNCYIIGTTKKNPVFSSVCPIG